MAASKNNKSGVIAVAFAPDVVVKNGKAYYRKEADNGKEHMC